MTSKNEIVGTMTIHEAAAHWSDPPKNYLVRWAETFLVPLRDLHIVHARTHQKEHSGEAIASQVEIEVAALLDLLKQTGLGEEIARVYRPLSRNGHVDATRNCCPSRTGHQIHWQAKEGGHATSVRKRMYEESDPKNDLGTGSVAKRKALADI